MRSCNSRSQIEDLALDRDVERRQRLVGDDQRRLRGERPRDGDALALAAGEFVRIAVQRIRRQADLLDQIGGARAPLAAVADALDAQAARR